MSGVVLCLKQIQLGRVSHFHSLPNSTSDSLQLASIFLIECVAQNWMQCSIAGYRMNSTLVVFKYSLVFPVFVSKPCYNHVMKAPYWAPWTWKGVECWDQKVAWYLMLDSNYQCCDRVKMLQYMGGQAIMQLHKANLCSLHWMQVVVGQSTECMTQ